MTITQTPGFHDDPKLRFVTKPSLNFFVIPAKMYSNNIITQLLLNLAKLEIK